MAEGLITLLRGHDSFTLKPVRGFIVATSHQQVRVREPTIIKCGIICLLSINGIESTKLLELGKQINAHYGETRSEEFVFIAGKQKRKQIESMETIAKIKGKSGKTNDFLACSRERAWPK
nr:hypothetical protein Iba_chr03aCG18450 [Ipomoea batatas]